MRHMCAVALLCAVVAPTAQAGSQAELSSSVTNTPTRPVRFTCEALLRGADAQLLHGRHRLSLALFSGGDAWTPDSGLLLYGETAEVEVLNGRLTHAVGSGTPTFGTLTPSVLAASGQTADPEQVLWLQISVAGDSPQTVVPRTRLAAVPFAAAAGESERLGGYPAAAYAKTADLEKAAKAVVRLAGTGYNSFIGGGINNDASGPHTTIGAGYGNVAQGFGDSILGGFQNWVTRAYSSIGGGFQNQATGDYATVAGGDRNQATAPNATVGGGSLNAAQGAANTIAGGIYNWATRVNSTVGGGSQNQATGNYSTVPGGLMNSATGDYSFAAGRRAKAVTPGALVWADSQDADFTSSLPDSVRFRARNGLMAETSSDYPGLRVVNYGAGAGILSSVLSNFAGRFFSSTGSALYAEAATTGVGAQAVSAAGTAVRGTGYNGVSGITTNENGNGLIGTANVGSNGFALWAVSNAGYAGYFNGKVHVAGTFSKSAGSFKIDHPQDPANKYLSHSFVESPDMKNVYDGTVILGDGGRATVELPAYFEALNRDFRYQLTPIGAHAPLFVAEEIRDNRFVIAGGSAGLKVSWLVTGIRKDAYAQEHPIVVEQNKPASERGTYLNPREHGQPESKSVTAGREQTAGKGGGASR